MIPRLFTNALQRGHVARDYIGLVYRSQNSGTVDTGTKGHAAHKVLEAFEDHNRPLPGEPIVPVKTLAMVLTRDLQEMTPFLVGCGDGKIIGERLFKGCRVRLRGIPERRFIVSDIFWDEEEVRIKEANRHIEYVLPWNCLEFEKKAA